MSDVKIVEHIFTLDIAAAYAAGDTIEGVITMAGLSLGGGELTSLRLFNRQVLTPTINLHLFSASPVASTTTDNLAFVLADADNPKYLTTIEISTWIDIATRKVAVLNNIGIALPASRNIFIVAEARAAYTPTDADALRLLMNNRHN